MALTVRDPMGPCTPVRTPAWRDRCRTRCEDGSDISRLDRLAVSTMCAAGAGAFWREIVAVCPGDPCKTACGQVPQHICTGFLPEEQARDAGHMPRPGALAGTDTQNHRSRIRSIAPDTRARRAQISRSGPARLPILPGRTGVRTSAKSRATQFRPPHRRGARPRPDQRRPGLPP